MSKHPYAPKTPNTPIRNVNQPRNTVVDAVGITILEPSQVREAPAARISAIR